MGFVGMIFKPFETLPVSFALCSCPLLGSLVCDTLVLDESTQESRTASAKHHSIMDAVRVVAKRMDRSKGAALHSLEHCANISNFRQTHPAHERWRQTCETASGRVIAQNEATHDQRKQVEHFHMPNDVQLPVAQLQRFSQHPNRRPQRSGPASVSM